LFLRNLLQVLRGGVMKRYAFVIAIVLCAVVTSTIVTSTNVSASSFVQMLVAAAAERYGVPKFLALKVAKVESSFTCDAEGKAGELGPLQIKPATARMIGYKGLISALRSCGAGLEWGMKHLAMALKAGGIWKHNQGLAAKSKSPAAAEYERKVLSEEVSPLGAPAGVGAAAKRQEAGDSSIAGSQKPPRTGLTLRQANRGENVPLLPRGS
jgi:hypothetical protein